MEKITSPLLQRIFSAERQTYNGIFAAARSIYPSIETETFFHYIVQILEPLVMNMERSGFSNPSRAIQQWYEKILELLGKGLIGPKSRNPIFEKAFTALIHTLPEFSALYPDRFPGAIGNAILSIAAIPRANLDQWVKIMIQTGKMTGTLEEFLEVGKVAAWRCGLAHYRTGALEICRNLSYTLVQTALDLSTQPQEPQEIFLGHLKEACWRFPGEPAIPQPQAIPLLRRFGAFSGFGGPFITPPKVKLGNQGFLVSDDERYFLFIADIFGSVLLPLSPREYSDQLVPDGSESGQAPFSISSNGQLMYSQTLLPIQAFSGFTSFASLNNSFCITMPYSHTLYFGGIASPHAGRV